MKAVRRKVSVNNIKIQQLLRILAVVLVFFLTAGALLYWQNAITLEGLVLSVLGSVVIGLLFVFGVRVVQRNAFLDGFRNGRNGVERGRNES